MGNENDGSQNYELNLTFNPGAYGFLRAKNVFPHETKVFFWGGEGEGFFFLQLVLKFLKKCSVRLSIFCIFFHYNFATEKNDIGIRTAVFNQVKNLV
jgi:hypothetical protein